MEEEDETAGGEGGGWLGADGNGAGIGRKWHGRGIRERSGCQGQQLGFHLQGRGQDGSRRMPWGETGERERVAVLQENSAGESSGVGSSEGRP